MKQISHNFLIVFILLLAIVFPRPIFSQSAPISIDGLYEEWTDALSTVTDPPESIEGVDLLEMQVSNDEDHLFIKITTDSEFDLTDDLFDHNIRLYLDTDNNPETGFQIQEGYGSELGIIFIDRYAHFNVEPYSQVAFSDFSFRSSPTVTSNAFEMAIKRDAIPDGLNQLFESPTIRILLQNNINDDRLPNQGEIFSYTFDDTPVTPYVPIALEKENDNYIRTVFYNTLFNGLLNPERVIHFENVIKVLNPDIIAFSECGSTTSTDVKELLDAWIPLGNPEGWFVQKLEVSDVINASRWPIMQSWNNITRQFPTLIDLPESYGTNLLVTNAHLNCCGNDEARQEQVDAYAEFILDAKSPGGAVDIPDGTPFIYGGDLNLVGFAQQLTTLVTGDIQNTATYGLGGPLDWDGTDVTDQLPIQSDQRMDYTWRDDSSSFPPGRLDFTIFSDAVMNAEKSYVLETETMSIDRLALYGLNQNDTGSASDHFPVVVDFSINSPDGVFEISPSKLKLYPNPSTAFATLEFNNPSNKNHTLYVFSSDGSVQLKTENIRSQQVIIETENWSSGTYLFQLIEGNIILKSGKLIVN